MLHIGLVYLLVLSNNFLGLMDIKAQEFHMKMIEKIEPIRPYRLNIY